MWILIKQQIKKYDEAFEELPKTSTLLKINEFLDKVKSIGQEAKKQHFPSAVNTPYIKIVIAVEKSNEMWASNRATLYLLIVLLEFR